MNNPTNLQPFYCHKLTPTPTGEQALQDAQAYRQALAEWGVEKKEVAG